MKSKWIYKHKEKERNESPSSRGQHRLFDTHHVCENDSRLHMCVWKARNKTLKGSGGWCNQMPKSRVGSNNTDESLYHERMRERRSVQAVLQTESDVYITGGSRVKKRKERNQGCCSYRESPPGCPRIGIRTLLRGGKKYWVRYVCWAPPERARTPELGI